MVCYGTFYRGGLVFIDPKTNIVEYSLVLTEDNALKEYKLLIKDKKLSRILALSLPGDKLEIIIDVQTYPDAIEYHLESVKNIAVPGHDITS